MKSLIFDYRTFWDFSRKSAPAQGSTLAFPSGLAAPRGFPRGNGGAESPGGGKLHRTLVPFLCVFGIRVRDILAFGGLWWLLGGAWRRKVSYPGAVLGFLVSPGCQKSRTLRLLAAVPCSPRGQKSRTLVPAAAPGGQKSRTLMLAAAPGGEKSRTLVLVLASLVPRRRKVSYPSAVGGSWRPKVSYPSAGSGAWRPKVSYPGASPRPQALQQGASTGRRRPVEAPC